MSGNPRVGWIRSNESIGSDVTKELSRLSAENSDLRKEIERLKKMHEEHTDAVRDAVHIMNENKRYYRVRTESSWDSSRSFTQTLLEIFLIIAPNLIDENDSKTIAKNIAFEKVGNEYHNFWPIGNNKISGLIADFVALDLIEPSEKKHSVNDENTYWSLTKLGKQVLKQARRIQLEEGIETKEQKESEADSEES
jgi:hypothetical protein